MDSDNKEVSLPGVPPNPQTRTPAPYRLVPYAQQPTTRHCPAGGFGAQVAGRAAAPGLAASGQCVGPGGHATQPPPVLRSPRTWRMGAKQAPSWEHRAAQAPCPQRHRLCSHRHCLPGHQRAPNGCVSWAGGPASRTTQTGLLTSLSTSPNPLPTTHPQPEHPRSKSRGHRSQESSIVVPSARSGHLLILPAGLDAWAQGGGISGPWGTDGTRPPAQENGPDGSCASQGAGHTPDLSSQQLLLPNSSRPAHDKPRAPPPLWPLCTDIRRADGSLLRVESYHPPLRAAAQPYQVKLGEQLASAA